jgi:hypothetical protein
MGMRMPETCWAVFKWQVINLRICCIWFVDSVENKCNSLYSIGISGDKLLSVTKEAPIRSQSNSCGNGTDFVRECRFFQHHYPNSPYISFICHAHILNFSNSQLRQISYLSLSPSPSIDAFLLSMKTKLGPKLYTLPRVRKLTLKIETKLLQRRNRPPSVIDYHLRLHQECL